jgi:hypothetical protein
MPTLWVLRKSYYQETINLPIMTVDQLNNSKIPIIVFDKKLEQFRGQTLFPEKLAKANEILAKAGLPKTQK